MFRSSSDFDKQLGEYDARLPDLPKFTQPRASLIELDRSTYL